MSIRDKDDPELTFCLVKLPEWRHPYWMEKTGGRFVNENGGGFPARTSVQVLETVKTPYYEDLDHKKTGLYLDVDPASKDGWLDPQGNYYPCGHAKHRQYARLILKQEDNQLETAGWAKCMSCHAGSEDEESPWYLLWDREKGADGGGMKPTPAQIKKLIELGFPIMEWDK